MPEDPSDEDDWRAVPDEEGGQYFWNIRTGETRWDMPTPTQSRSRTESGGSGGGESSNGWSRAFAEDGTEYWYHAESGETSWEQPAGAGEHEEPISRPPPRMVKPTKGGLMTEIAEMAKSAAEEREKRVA